MFPQEAITIIEHNETGNDVLNKQILPTGDYRILNISVLSKDNRTNTVYCGSTPILTERAGTTFINEPFSYFCQNSVKVDLYRTSSIHITYEETNANTSTTTPTRTDSMIGSISLGLSIIITLLFIITIGFIFNSIDKKAKTWRY